MHQPWAPPSHTQAAAASAGALLSADPLPPLRLPRHSSPEGLRSPGAPTFPEAAPAGRSPVPQATSPGRTCPRPRSTPDAPGSARPQAARARPAPTERSSPAPPGYLRFRGSAGPRGRRLGRRAGARPLGARLRTPSGLARAHGAAGQQGVRGGAETRRAREAPGSLRTPCSQLGALQRERARRSDPGLWEGGVPTPARVSACDPPGRKRGPYRPRGCSSRPVASHRHGLEGRRGAPTPRSLPPAGGARDARGRAVGLRFFTPAGAVLRARSRRPGSARGCVARPSLGAVRPRDRRGRSGRDAHAWAKRLCRELRVGVSSCTWG